MKKYIRYSLMLILLFSLSSCLFTEDNVFDESPAQRLNGGIAEARETLVQAENGWVMLYFPYGESQGYNFMMKFNTNGIADVGAKNKYTPAYTVNQGCWDIIGDTGPVLTFNTYIDNFTIFADPKAPGAKDADGIGLGGDYEFIIMLVTPDEIQLKGKKRGTNIVMRALPTDQTWEGYLKSVDDFSKLNFFNGSPDLYFAVGDSTYRFYDAYLGKFFSLNTQASIETIPTETPFIPTLTGIRFGTYFITEPLPAAIEFNFNEDKTALVDKDDETVRLIPESIPSYLKKTASKYLAAKADLGGTFQTLFEKMETEFTTKYSGKRNLTFVGLTNRDGQLQFVIRATSNEANIILPFSINTEANTLTILPFDETGLTPMEVNVDGTKTGELVDINAENFYRDIVSIQAFLKAIQGTYILSTNDSFILNTITYTNVDKTTDYLKLTR